MMARSFPRYSVAYPSAAKRFMHSSGLKRSQTLPAAYHRSSTVRGFRRFMWALNFENASLIGLKSGEYGGRNKSQAPRLSTARLASSHLCAGLWDNALAGGPFWC